MANSDKNIVITPNIGSSSDDPKVVFTGANTAGLYPITLRAYPTSSGTLSFEGSAGQLFSITNSLTGTLFSVNDVSGMPSIEVVDTGLVKLAQYSGNVVIGSSSDNTGKLQLQSNTWSNSTGTDFVIRNFNSVGAGMTLRPMNSSSFSAGWSVYAGASSAAIGDGALGFWNHTTQSHRFWVDQSANAYAITSFRAPIFYDSNNTGYYVDPASISNFNDMYINGGVAGISNSSSYTEAAIEIRERGFAGPQDDTWATAPRISFHWGGRVASQIAMSSSGRITILNNPGNSVEALQSGNFYAPIFYDSDNTSYYLDPASTSNLNKVYYNSNAVFSNYGIGQVGFYSAYRYQAVFSMGESYLLPADGTTTGNLYGIAWSHPYAGGAASNLASHGMLILENGGFYGAWGGGRLVTVADIRGTIFYDYNNTGYYCDPASTSVLSTVQFASGVYLQSASTAGDRNLKVRGTASSDVGITGYDSSDNWRFQLYGSSSNYGFLNSLWGAWDLQKTVSGNLYMNNNTGYYLNAPSDNFLYRVYGAADIRSPIFYDYDNTGYYINAASTSNISALQTADSVVIGGVFGNNSYDAVSGTRLLFGGGNDPSNYFIGTNLENYGGNYTKLDLRWHTGIRMGAQLGYGGIRFFDSEDLGTLRFHIEGSSGYIYKYVWMYTNTNGIYSDTNSAHWHPNNATSYGSWAALGNRNGFYGIALAGANVSYPHIMFDGNGGGLYSESYGRWMLYHSFGNNSLGIGASTTSSSYKLYVSGAIYSTDNIVAYSDKRAKENIVSIDSPLTKVHGLRGVYYNKIGKPETREVGVIAQEINEILPEVVTHDKENDQYGVSYGNITALLIEAVKELSAEVKRLKEKIGG